MGRDLSDYGYFCWNGNISTFFDENHNTIEKEKDIQIVDVKIKKKRERSKKKISGNLVIISNTLDDPKTENIINENKIDLIEETDNKPKDNDIKTKETSISTPTKRKTFDMDSLPSATKKSKTKEQLNESQLVVDSPKKPLETSSSFDSIKEFKKTKKKVEVVFIYFLIQFRNNYQ